MALALTKSHPKQGHTICKFVVWGDAQPYLCTYSCFAWFPFNFLRATLKKFGFLFNNQRGYLGY